MKTIHRLSGHSFPVAMLAVVLLTTPATADPFINEVFFDTPGTDSPNEYVEIRGTPSQALTGVYLIFLEGDSGANPGDIQNIFDLTSFSIGSNGFLLLRQASNPYGSGAHAVAAGTTDLVNTQGTGWGSTGASDVGFSTDVGTDIENPGHTAFLINIGAGSAPTLTQDLDTDDNELDALPSGWTILDGYSVVDDTTDRAYAQIVFSEVAGFTNAEAGATVIIPGITPIEYVMRQGDSTGSTASDWFAADTEGTAPGFTMVAGENSGTPAFDGFLVASHLGATNPAIPEPSSLALAGLAALFGAAGYGWRRRKRSAP